MLTSTLRAAEARLSAPQLTARLAAAALSVLLLGVGALSSGAAEPASSKTTAAKAVAAAVVGPQVTTPEVTAPAPPVSRKAPPVQLRSKAAAAPRKPAPTPERYLPSGTGMWLHDWSRSEQGHAPQVVARAQAAGLTHLFVQTGSSKKGWIGSPVLSQLLPATKGTGIKVIAWDFPKLLDPEGDARRLARAAKWARPGEPRVAAVAPDIETKAEGTHATKSSIERYYRTLRASLPDHIAILATVPWPSEKRISSYPYTRTALHADAFIPMAYWYNRSPSVVTATSMAVLKQLGLPVFPVGQGYDGRLDAPYLAPDPTPGKSVDAFVQAARTGGATSLSLWSWQTTGPQQWSSLMRASGHFQPAKPLTVSPKGRRSGWHPGRDVSTG